MIKKENFQDILNTLGFTKTKNIYTKKFKEFSTELKVDFSKELLIYPEKDGFTVNERQTCNFKQAENFVVFECVDKLLSQGYNPKHIELEPKWQVGHGASGGRADILIKDNTENALLIIECKTAGSEFTKAWNTTQVKPTQLFSYVQQVRSTKFIALYASDLVDSKIKADYYLINVTDNKKLLENNTDLKSYKDANTVEEIYQVWVVSILWGIDGDWMVNYIEANKPFYPTDHCGVIRVKGKEVHPRYLAWVLHREGESVRFSRTHRASTDRVKGISIKAPSFAEQESLIKKIQRLEDVIKKAELIVESASEKKQAVLKKYL